MQSTFELQTGGSSNGSLAEGSTRGTPPAAPDGPLAGLPVCAQPHPHYPAFQELVSTLHHSQDSPYKGFQLPADMPEFEYGMTHVTQVRPRYHSTMVPAT